MTLSRRTYVWGIIWGSVALLSAGAALFAFNPQPDPPGHYYGLMTMRPGQSLSVHVVNVRPAVADARRASESLCHADVQIVGPHGELLARDGGRVMPGETFSLDFLANPPEPDRPGGSDPPEPDMPGGTNPPDPDMPGAVNPPEPDYQRLRVQVLLAGPSGHCLSNVEVGDPVGVGDPIPWRGGAFVHPGLIVGFNPQPDPPGAPQPGGAARR